MLDLSLSRGPKTTERGASQARLAYAKPTPPKMSLLGPGLCFGCRACRSGCTEGLPEADHSTLRRPSGQGSRARAVMNAAYSVGRRDVRRAAIWEDYHIGPECRRSGAAAIRRPSVCGESGRGRAQLPTGRH